MLQVTTVVTPDNAALLNLPPMADSFRRHAVHPMDSRMLMLASAEDFATFGREEFKGGIWQNILPQHVMDFFTHADNATIEALRGRQIPMSPGTGEILFPQDMVRRIPADVMDFFQKMGAGFNQAGPWRKEFLIQTNLGTRQISEGFHLDSKSASVIRQFRAFFNISGIAEDQDHETEWLAADGLTEQDVRGLVGFSRPLEELPERFRRLATYVTSRDMFLNKGLGDGLSNYATDGPLHRAPPHKNDYPAQGKRRVAVIWQREIIEDDLDMG